MGRFGWSAGLVAGLLTIFTNAVITFAVAAVWLRSGCCWHARRTRPLCKRLVCQARAGKGRPCSACVRQDEAIKDARRDGIRGPCSPVDLICPGAVTVGMCMPTKSSQRIGQRNARNSTNATAPGVKWPLSAAHGLRSVAVVAPQVSHGLQAMSALQKQLPLMQTIMATSQMVIGIGARAVMVP